MYQAPLRLHDSEPSATISPEMSAYLDLVRFSAALVVFFSHTCGLTAGFMCQLRPHGVEAPPWGARTREDLECGR
jgi:hypothetical protein